MSSVSLLVSIGQMDLWICLIQTTQRSEAIGRQFAWGKMTFFILKLPIPPPPPSPTLNTDSLQQWALWENRQVVRHGRRICIPLPLLFCHHLPLLSNSLSEWGSQETVELPLSWAELKHLLRQSLSSLNLVSKCSPDLPGKVEGSLSLFTVMGPDTVTQRVQTAGDRGKGHSQLFPRLLQKQLLPTSPTLNIIST